ncbi:hypothetical protein MKW98_027656, partial [Papaver atlanticum]
MNPFVSLKKPIETLHLSFRWEEVGGLLQRSSMRVDHLHVQFCAREKSNCNTETTNK